MKVSKEIKAIEKALKAFYDKHGGNVMINTSVIAFNDEYDVVEDRLWLIGDKETLLVNNECMVKEIEETFGS